MYRDTSENVTLLNFELYDYNNKVASIVNEQYCRCSVELVLSKEVGSIPISTHAVKRTHMNMPVTTAFIKCFSSVQIAIIGFCFNL